MPPLDPWNHDSLAWRIPLVESVSGAGEGPGFDSGVCRVESAGDMRNHLAGANPVGALPGTFRDLPDHREQWKDRWR